MSKRSTIITAVAYIVAAVLFLTYFYYHEVRSAVSRQFISTCQTAAPDAKGFSTTTDGLFVWLTPTTATSTLIASCDTSAADAYSLDLLVVASSSGPNGSQPPTVLITREYSSDNVVWFWSVASSAQFGNASSTQTAFGVASTTDIAWRIGSEGGNLDATSTLHVEYDDTVARFVRVRVWVADGNAAVWGVIQKRESN